MANYSYLEITGIVVLSYFGIRLSTSILRGIWTNFLGHFLGFGVKWRPGDNVWAVITGGTDGIGLQYAKQLAAKGYSIVIISRNQNKLNSVAESLMKQNPKCKEVKTIAVDFNRDDIYDQIETQLNKLDLIDVLVNNVGTVYRTEYFTKIPVAYNKTYLNVNMLSYTKMIEIILPKMVQQKRGIIINISSQASERPMPLMTTYAATKAYVTFLSEALSVEYESKGIIIQTVLPSLVHTNLVSEDFKVPFVGITPEDCVSSAIKTVGIETFTYGHWKHKLLAYVTSTIASILSRQTLLRLTLSQLKPVRNEFYKRNKLIDDF